MTANSPDPLKHTSIVGLQWGDEGKGKIVDLLTQEYDVIVRYNGGANAGHTVVIEGEKYALHLLPSGILSDGKLNIVGNGVVIDPMQLWKEIQMLAERGKPVGDKLKISDRAHVVMPYHKSQDQIFEAAMSAARGDGKNIGTTGRGIGPCYSDKATRSTALRMDELVDPDRLADKLRQVVTVKNAMLPALAELGGCEYSPLNADELIETYTAIGQSFKPYVTDTGLLLNQQVKAGKKVLYEGANACMLDVDHGTYPFVTSSNCSSLGIHAGSATPGKLLERTLGIVKAYTTRVGEGPFVTELTNAIGDRIRDRGHEYGTTTGRARRCGWLDLAVVKYSARLCGVDAIALMLFDVMAGFDTLKICTGYQYHGEIMESFPSDSSILKDVKPIYAEMPGFAEEIDEYTEYDQLPSAAKNYVEFVEKELGVPVAYVSVGPDRAQTIKKI